jgi:hypothetical protein
MGRTKAKVDTSIPGVAGWVGQYLTTITVEGA